MPTGPTDVAMRRATGLLGEIGTQPESFWYSVKRRLLGPPMVNEQLRHQRLSKPLALGVLSPDGISSSAYGTEEILIALLPLAGLAAFTLILPMTLAILVVMALVVLSYREVVMVYIRPGGSYVVARENFGPKIAQITAVALLIDYVVTVAVQTAAGTAAVVSAFPALGPYAKEITIGVILVMCYGNLRGIREAGRMFAVPTYLFAGSVLLMILAGLAREAAGDLPRYNPHALSGHYPIGSGTAGLLTFAMIFTLLRAFANGGASLTGIEAVSDAVGAFRPPEGVNARQVLVAEGLILGSLVAGISWLAHATRATPRVSGYPTVLAQETQAVFGHSVAGQALFFLVQAATALILYTGGNTSFNGFPFLASYVAGDAFLPRWLLKRGHRLVFSNAIVVLTAVSIALIIVRGANVNNLVPMYAIGVFTAFSMAGFGMARYHLRRREPGWRRRLVTNGAAGVLTAIVVVIFAVVKFTEGAWLVVVLFPILVFALIRLNREYRLEAEVLERVGRRIQGQPKPPEPPNYPRRTVFLLVDSFDLATLAALRYARGLHPTTLRAVHCVIDTAQAEALRQDWAEGNRGVVLDFIDCPDRRLTRCATDLVAAEAAKPGTFVTVVLPRRSYSPLLGRFLHDRTADKIATAVSRIPNCAATIIPYDVRARIEMLNEHQLAKASQKAALAAAGGAGAGGTAVAGAATAARPAEASPAAASAGPAGTSPAAASAGPAGRPAKPSYERPAPSPGASPIGSLQAPGRATVEGRVRSVEIRPVEKSSVLAVEIADSTGDLTALFYGRSHIPGLGCGSRVRFRGPVGVRADGPVMINPAYELLPAGPEPGREQTPP
jgi:amino acid transporter